MNGWMRWLPGLQMLRRYEAAWLPNDLMAGLVLTTMLVPVGIAYAVASGVPGIYGLYATIVPLLAYALFGPSRILVLGPDSALAAVILAVVLPLSAGDPARAVIVASLMARTRAAPSDGTVVPARRTAEARNALRARSGRGRDRTDAAVHLADPHQLLSQALSRAAYRGA